MSYIAIDILKCLAYFRHHSCLYYSVPTSNG